MKVVVFDDDPTGSQTVHSCPLLLATDAASLRRGLAHPSPLLFVLANTRALAPAQARERVAVICANLAAALAQITAQEPDLAARLQPLVLVSRGDSTLRGHFPLELQVIEQQLAAPLGWAASGVDGRFLVPAFLPGGRTTVGGVQRLHGEPVHTSDFARDRLFGYDTSDLAEYIAVGCKPRSAFRIGTEHEKFGFRLDDLKTPPYEPSDGQPGCIRDLLGGLARYDAWLGIRTRRRISKRDHDEVRTQRVWHAGRTRRECAWQQRQHWTTPQQQAEHRKATDDFPSVWDVLARVDVHAV